MKKFICKYDRECNDYEILSGYNIFYLKGKRFPIKKNNKFAFLNYLLLLYYFKNNIFKLGMISGKELFTFVFQIIIKVVPQIIILILYTIGNIAFIKEI